MDSNAEYLTYYPRPQRCLPLRRYHRMPKAAGARLSIHPASHAGHTCTARRSTAQRHRHASFKHAGAYSPAWRAVTTVAQAVVSHSAVFSYRPAAACSSIHALCTSCMLPLLHMPRSSLNGGFDRGGATSRSRQKSMHLAEGAALQQRIRHWAVVPRVGGVEGVVALQPHVPLRHLQTASTKYETQAVRFAVHNPMRDPMQ